MHSETLTPSFYQLFSRLSALTDTSLGTRIAWSLGGQHAPEAPVKYKVTGSRRAFKNQQARLVAEPRL